MNYDKTNGDRIRECTNEELVTVFKNLREIVIYSGGENKRLLSYRDPDDFLIWLNKVSDELDDYIFEKSN